MRSKPFFKSQAEAEATYFELLRYMKPSERSAVSRRLTIDLFRRQREELRRANPDAAKREIDVLFVELNYGKDLANRVRDDLIKRGEL